MTHFVAGGNTDNNWHTNVKTEILSVSPPLRVGHRWTPMRGQPPHAILLNESAWRRCSLVVSVFPSRKHCCSAPSPCLTQLGTVSRMDRLTVLHGECSDGFWELVMENPSSYESYFSAIRTVKENRRILYMHERFLKPLSIGSIVQPSSTRSQPIPHHKDMMPFSGS